MLFHIHHFNQSWFHLKCNQSMDQRFVAWTCRSIVRSIDGSAFGGVTLLNCLIESDNRRCAFENAFLVDVVDYKLIRSFSTSSHIRIPYDIEILGSSCFFGCDPLSYISFESNPRISRPSGRVGLRAEMAALALGAFWFVVRGSCFVVRRRRSGHTGIPVLPRVRPGAEHSVDAEDRGRSAFLTTLAIGATQNSSLGNAIALSEVVGAKSPFFQGVICRSNEEKPFYLHLHLTFYDRGMPDRLQAGKTTNYSFPHAFQ
jgi:hypothetical protein